MGWEVRWAEPKWRTALVFGAEPGVREGPGREESSRNCRRVGRMEYKHGVCQVWEITRKAGTTAPVSRSHILTSVLFLGPKLIFFLSVYARLTSCSPRSDSRPSVDQPCASGLKFTAHGSALGVFSAEFDSVGQLS